MDNQAEHFRRGSNQSIGSSSSSPEEHRKVVAAEISASTIDFIQNLKLDHIPARNERDEEVPSYIQSALVERKPIAANLRHLDESSRSSTARQNSLPSLTSSATSSRSHYSRSESDGGLGRKKPRRTSSDADSSVLTPLYQAVSAGASLYVITSLVQSDPSSVGRVNGGGLTPLHCAIERYDTPVSVLYFLLESLPSTAALKCFRGFTPVDLLWKRFVEPDAYRSDEVKEQAAQLRLLLEQAVNVDTEQTHVAGENQLDTPGITSRRQARANLALHDRPELRAFWEMMSVFICAACHGTTASAGVRVRLVHDSVSIECSPLLIRFCAAQFPDELLEPDETCGRMPLHIAAANGSLDILQTLLELEPQATMVQDKNGQLPLHLAIQAELPWEGALEHTVATYPQSLAVADPITGLVPAMAASESVQT